MTETTMTLEQILVAALAQATLFDALERVAIWENDRAVQQALKGRRDPHTGQLWETCFRYAFDRVLKEWTDKRGMLSSEHGTLSALCAVEKAAAAFLDEGKMYSLTHGTPEHWAKRLALRDALTELARVRAGMEAKE